MEMELPEGIEQNEIYKMEENRLQKLDEAGINERDVLRQARENINVWNGYFNENYVRGKDDANFVLRDQWTAIERSEFTRLFKPAMTFNKLYDCVKKISGEQRKNKPDLMVRSLTGRATQEQINLRADLVRTISYQSENDLIYQHAFNSALLRGYGAFRICLDYESPTSFNQVIKYKLVKDPMLSAFDPSSEMPHKGDGNFCSESYIFKKDEFFATYPYITNPISYTDQNTLLNFEWETRDTIIVNDYFVKEWSSTIIYKLSNGFTVTQKEWEDLQETFRFQKEIAKSSSVVGDIILKEMPKIVRERQTQDYRIMHYRLIKDSIIDFSVWPSKHLPIIFVDGDSHFIDGRQYTRSFIHEARDAQKFLNFVNSEIAAEIKNRRREQWLGSADNIIGNEQQWRNPELQTGILIAKPDQKTGQMPAKLPPWDLSPALLQHGQRATMDMREILGFAEANQNNSRDISGIAKRERKIEGSESAYIYFDNLNQAIQQSGRVVLDLLPTIAGNDERHMIISKPDGKSQSVILNKEMPDGSIHNVLEPGEFDVEIDAGPNFSVQKEVALEFFTQTIQAFPQAFPLIADLWASNLDIQFMPQIKARFESLVPPEILAKEQGKPAPPKQPSPQEQMAQAMAQAEMQEKQAAIQEKQAEIKIKMEEVRLKQEQNELDKAELLLKAQKIQNDSQLDIFNHQANIERARITHELDHKKTDLDFGGKIASILSDVYRHENKSETKNKSEK